MRPIVASLVAAIVFVATAAVAAAGGYHGTLTIDYRYTSGGDITPGGPADVEQTAHLTLTVRNDRIVHMHGVVGLDYKARYDLCPDFVVHTSGGGTVDAKPDLGGSYAFLPTVPPNWPPKGRYVTPEPAAPPAPVTTVTTHPAQDCTSLTDTTKATFQVGYIPALTGAVPAHATRLVGSLTRHAVGVGKCHPFNPLPPPPPVGVSCLWRERWSLLR